MTAGWGSSWDSSPLPLAQYFLRDPDEVESFLRDLIDALDQRPMSERKTSDWILTYIGWNPDQQPLREALCVLGNGYMATRGAALTWRGATTGWRPTWPGMCSRTRIWSPGRTGSV